jgi:hypothetical protein
MTLNNDRSNSLENQVALLKKEVDALQVESMSSKKPWYRWRTPILCTTFN